MQHLRNFKLRRATTAIWVCWLVAETLGASRAAAEDVRPFPPQGVVVEPPPMPVDRQMAKPAPKTGDSAIVGPAPGQQATSVVDRETYEDAQLDRLGELSRRIVAVRQGTERLRGSERDLVMKPLRTAAGNRVVAITKLQHLFAAPEATWIRLKPAVDRSFAELEGAVNRAESALAH